MACRRGDLKDEAGRIRAALAMGYSVAKVARLYECTPTAVRRIRDGESYGDSPGSPGPVPGTRREEAPVYSAQAVDVARLDRALAHWLKNEEDMSAAEVAEMYDVDEGSLHARRRKERK